MDQQQKPSQPLDKKTTYVVLAIIVIIALAAWGIYAKTHQKSSIQTASHPVAGPAENLSNTSTPSSTPASPAKPSANKLSYSDAIKAYPERFQFVRCQGTPAIIAVKKGTPVMLDNRDAVSHTFKADTQTFKIAGYNYAVAYPSVIGKFYVSCDGVNRVTLNVEK